MLVVYLQEDKKRRPWRDMMQEKTWDDPVVCRVSRVQTWEYTTAGTKHCFWYYIRVFSWLKKVVLLPSWVFFVNFLFFIVSFVVFYLSLCILVLHLLFLWMKPTTNALSSATLHLTSCGLPVHEWMDTIIFKHNTHTTNPFHDGCLTSVTTKTIIILTNTHLTNTSWPQSCTLTSDVVSSWNHQHQDDKERRKAEVRARLEAQAKKKKRGFMTPERKKRLRVTYPFFITTTHLTPFISIIPSFCLSSLQFPVKLLVAELIALLQVFLTTKSLIPPEKLKRLTFWKETARGHSDDMRFVAKGYFSFGDDNDE